MAAITSALIAIAGVVLGWIATEIACKPCLQSARGAIDRSLNPDYDPDVDEAADHHAGGARAPLLSDPDPDPAASTAAAKAV